jgi:hypothetical protein
MCSNVRDFAVDAQLELLTWHGAAIKRVRANLALFVKTAAQ